MRTMIASVLMVAAATAAGAQTAPSAESRPDGGTSPAVTMPTIRIIPATPAAGPAAGKYKTDLVCKSSVETGSLVAKRKVCLTRKQWNYVNQANEDEAHRMMMDNMNKPGCGGPAC